jgi:general secretion pathway protein J
MTTRAHAGLTLIELVIAVALLAVIATLGYGALVQSLRAQERTALSVSALRATVRTMANLEREFESASAREIRTRSGLAVGAFLAAPGYVEFTTATLAPNGDGIANGHLVRVRYDDEAGQLLRRHWRVLDRAGDTEAVDSTPALEGVAGLRLRYMDDTGAWVEKWPNGAERSLPRAVEMTGELATLGAFRRMFRVGGW